MSLSQLSDADLLMRWRGGETAAGSALVRRHHPRIRRVFCINASSNDWVADMVQQTFLAFCERRDHIQDPEKVKSYLLGIANNLLRDHFKSRHRKLGNETPDVDALSLVDVEAPGLTTFFTNRQERASLLIALRHVPLADQLLLQYKYWDALTNREIAEILDIPLGTVASRIRSAKLRLGTELQRASNGETAQDSFDEVAARSPLANTRSPSP